MKKLITILGLVTCMSGVAVTSDADSVPWPFSDATSRSMNGRLLNGRHALSSDYSRDGFSPESEITTRPTVMQSFLACIATFSVCMADARVEAILLVTDPTTLIGHLTLDQYASLAEISTVTDMYLTEDGLTVRFFGGAWPGSLLSVFETSFPL